MSSGDSFFMALTLFGLFGAARTSPPGSVSDILIARQARANSGVVGLATARRCTGHENGGMRPLRWACSCAGVSKDPN